MPKVGQSMEEGTVVEWHAAEGDQVAQGQVIVTIETDKATYELESPAAGPLRILVPQGEEVPVETPLAAIGSVTVPREQRPAPKTAVAAAPERAGAGATRGPAMASPRAKKLAAEHGIDLSAIVATSKDGVISAGDVERVIAERQSAPAPGKAAPAATAARPVRERKKLTGIKRATARRTQEAWQTIPHIVQMVTVDATGLLAQRRRLEAAGTPTSINDLLVYHAAQVMARHPELNGTVEGDELLLYEGVDVGFAVDTPRGLLVPVLRGADRMSPEQLSAESRRLVEAARGSGLKPEEVGHASLTVSNLGMFGIRTGTPVINLGEAVLVFVGAVEERPAVVDGQVVARPLMDLSVAYDHRVADGVQAAAFTRDLAAAIEALRGPGASTTSAEPSPAAGLAKRELRSTSEADSYVVRVDSPGGRVITLDEPAAEGGTDQGPTPVDAFLAGLLGCLTISFKAAGRRRNVPIERIDGHVKTNENGHLKEIRLTLEVWSPAPEENVRALLERAERGCYISALLKPEVDYQLELFVHPS